MTSAQMVKFLSSASGVDTQSPLYTIPPILDKLLDQGKTTNFLEGEEHKERDQSRINLQKVHKYRV